MKASHLIILMGGFAALGLSLYVTKFSNRDSVALGLNNALSSVDTSKLSHQSNEHGGAITLALADLKEEVALLKVEVATLKASVGSSDMQREFLKLQEKVAALHPRIGNVSTAGEYSGHTENFKKPAELTEQDIIAATEEQKHKRRKQMEIIDGVFLSEPIDYQWSTKTTDLITQSLGTGEQMQTNLSNVECHTTLCRVEVNHHDAAAAKEFELQFPMQVGGALPQISYLYEPQEDGSTNVIMYLARKGYDLPQAIP